MLVTREGHIYTRHSVSFHAPDSELHGVLTRQREIEELETDLVHEREAHDGAQGHVTESEEAIERHKGELAELREIVAQTQQRHHALQMDALRMSEQAQRLTQRGEQIALELAEITEHKDTETAHREEAAANLARLQEETAEARAQLELATDLYHRADSVLKLQREELQRAQQAHQEALFESRSAQAKIDEIENSIRLLTDQTTGLSASLAIETEALASCDETPWQTQLQQALATAASANRRSPRRAMRSKAWRRASRKSSRNG